MVKATPRFGWVHNGTTWFVNAPLAAWKVERACWVLTDKHVGGGQGSDEVIAGLSYAPIDDEGQKDQDVSCHRQHNANSQANGYENRLPQFEGRKNCG